MWEVKRANEASEHLPEERRHSPLLSCISPSLGPAFGSLLLLAGPFGGWVHWLTHPELFLAISAWRGLVEIPTSRALGCLPDLLETLWEGAKLHSLVWSCEVLGSFGVLSEHFPSIL